MSKLAYSIEEFCEMAAIGRSTVYGEIAAGRLQVAKVGRRTIIPADAAQAWLAKIIADSPMEHTPNPEAA